MKILPIQNSYKFRFGVNQNSQAGQNTTPKNSVVKESENTAPVIYYYNNIQYPNEARTYSSMNPEMLERPGNFKINKFDKVPCPACGKYMLTMEKYDKFTEELDSTNPDEYLNLLEKYKDYMRPVESKVLEDITELSQKTGEKDIRTLIVTLRDTNLPILQKIQKSKLKKMRSLAKTLPDKEKEILLKKLTKLETYIKDKTQEAPFRRKRMIEGIRRTPIKNPHKYKKLQNIADSFPTSKDIDSAWIVKYSGKNKKGEDWSSKDIAKRLLEFSVPNTDHILAYSTYKHHDEIPNYMSMHSGCNGQKGDKSFPQWVNEDKTLRINSLSAYFETVKELISSGKLNDSRYKNYVANATQNISEASKGSVNITV